ncbi:MAG: ABC transporter ATP-binding protein [Treponemataceae bacterium]
MNAFRLASVSYRYRVADRCAVDEVSLNLSVGMIEVVVGANGSGKSTLLGLASGRLRPASGTARIGEAEIARLSPFNRAARIAVLPQAERVAFDFSCLDFVLFARAHKRSPFAAPGAEDFRAARSALETLGVEALAERPVTELSGGELQLVRLARCVAQEASLLVLDEPTAMLDPAHSSAVARAVRVIAESGKAVLLATHDLAFAAAVADRALVLRQGRAVAEDEPSRAFDLGILEKAFGVAFESRLAPMPVNLLNK